MIIPLIMIVCGFFMWKLPVRKVNHLFGYRTSMSKKNLDTWLFANMYCGRIWLIGGFVMMVPVFVVMACMIGKDLSTLEGVYTFVLIIQCVVIIATIIPVEIALRANFNKDGSRK